MTKYYFAAPFHYKAPLIDLMGWMHSTSKDTVTSSWLFIKAENEAHTARQAEAYALQDLRDIDAADILILFNPPGEKQTPGRNIEFGYALARGKQIWICGQRLGVFQQSFSFPFFTDIEHIKHHLRHYDDPAYYSYPG